MVILVLTIGELGRVPQYDVLSMQQSDAAISHFKGLIAWGKTDG